MSIERANRLDLTVVIISYNSGRIIVDNLRAIVGSDRFNAHVVDNCSRDNSAALLAENFPADRLIRLDRNIGYGRAANAAFKQLTTRYALLLNPDIRVTEQQVVDFFQDVEPLFERAAVVAPATSERDYLRQGVRPEVDVLGAAMLFDMQQLGEVGWFDENLFLFYEEKDLCKRIVDSGKTILLSTDHAFAHDKGTSSGGSDRINYAKQWHIGWSSCYYLRKHELAKGRMRPLALLLRYVVKSGLSLKREKRLRYRARVAGVIAYLRDQGAFDQRGNPRGFMDV